MASQFISMVAIPVPITLFLDRDERRAINHDASLGIDQMPTLVARKLISSAVIGEPAAGDASSNTLIPRIRHGSTQGAGRASCEIKPSEEGKDVFGASLAMKASRYLAKPA